MSYMGVSYINLVTVIVYLLLVDFSLNLVIMLPLVMIKKSSADL